MIGRSTGIGSPIVPVAHEDLRALVSELDEFRAALMHRGLAEANLQKLVEHAMRPGETFALAALRLIQSQQREIEQMREQFEAITNDAAEPEDTSPADDLDNALEILGFTEAE